MSVSVRPYRTGDQAALVALWSSVFPDDPTRNDPVRMIANKQRVQPDLLLVAVDGDLVVGAVMAGFDGTRGWIHHLAVDPDHRRLGIGTGLVAAAECGLHALGCPKVNLQIRAENPAVVAFYRRLGYAVEERVSMGKVLDG